jgi:hypothetical protein
MQATVTAAMQMCALATATTETVINFFENRINFFENRRLLLLLLLLLIYFPQVIVKTQRAVCVLVNFSFLLTLS